MGAMRIAATAVATSAALVTIAAVALSIPDAARYVRIRKM